MLSIGDQLRKLGFKSGFEPVDGFKYYMVQFLYNSSHPKHRSVGRLHLNTGEPGSQAERDLHRAITVCTYLLNHWARTQWLSGYAWPDGSLYYNVRIPTRSMRERDAYEEHLNQVLKDLMRIPSIPSEISESIRELGMVAKVFEVDPNEVAPPGASPAGDASHPMSMKKKFDSSGWIPS